MGKQKRVGAGMPVGRFRGRETAIGLAAAVAIILGFLAVRFPVGTESTQPKVPLAAEMYFSPTCGCCRNYAGYLESTDFGVRMMPVEDLEAVKDRLGIPKHLRSCHTLVIGGYFVEGHVPAEAITKLLQQKQEITGIALPGMPSGSPGMGGPKQGPLVVYAVGKGIEVFGRF